MHVDDGWQVTCLCAAWCGACREWQPLFDRVAAAHPQVRFAWVDIEDEADTLGEVDVETFPTLLISRGSQPLFYGPVPPLQAQLERLLSSLQTDPRAAASVSPESHGLLRSLSRL